MLDLFASGAVCVACVEAAECYATYGCRNRCTCMSKRVRKVSPLPRPQVYCASQIIKLEFNVRKCLLGQITQRGGVQDCLPAARSGGFRKNAPGR